MSSVQEFNTYREKMNERITAQDNKVLKRFFSLDIPHTRRATEYWDELEAEAKKQTY